MATHQTAAQLAKSWKTDPRWKGVTRPYSPEDVVRLRGTLPIEYTLARVGAERLWELLNSEKYVNALGAMSGNQAVQMVSAGLKAIYVSGWQVAADANNAGQMYPDQSLYPADSVPNLVPPPEQRADARRSDPSLRRQERHQLVCAAHRRRRSRFRRHAERLRADEVDDRSRRGLRSLRRSALVRQEVRTPRRQSAGPDQ